MRTLLFVTLLAVCFVGSPSIATPQDSCDKQFVASQVTLPMTTQLSSSEQAAIRARLIGRCFDDQQVAELAGRVRETLQSFGYFRATVSPTIAVVDVSRHPQPVSLNLDVVEGARYKVREITWLGVTAISSEQIIPISQIRPEDILDMSKVRETLEAARRLYAALGYPSASIVSEVQVHGTGHSVSLYFRVAEGAQAP
jgi:outer membrane protein insertion porin family